MSSAGPASATDPVPRIKGLYQVLPYVYLGDANAALNRDELKRLNISAVINAASSDVDSMFPEDFTYTEFPIEDKHDALPSAHFNACYDALSAVKEQRAVALIHCTTGKNISPTLLLAYMLLSAKRQDKHLPLLQAINFVQGRAPGSNPSEQFLAQLVDLEVELFEEASVKVKGAGRGGGGRGRGGRGGKGKRGK